MFWKKQRTELEALQKESVRVERAKEAARLNLQRSLRRLSRALEEIPLDDGLKSIGDSLAGNPERK